MALVNKFSRPDDFSTLDDYFVPTREEAFFGWYNRGRDGDTTATGDPIPGIAAYGFMSSFGGRYDTTAVAEPSAFDFGVTTDGLANDDFNGNAAFTADVGYVMELRISVDSLGWDLTEALSRMPISIGLQDTDYKFGSDGAANPNYSLSRVWWQGRWGNNYSDGIAYIAGDPSVTVSSGALPAYTEPEFRVGNANNTADLVVDGQLNEEAWTRTEPAFSFNYQPTLAELDNGLSGVVAPYYMFYFHPGDNVVIDPTEGRVHMLYQGSNLYFGLDTDDAAINGQEGEGGRDGFRIRIRSLDSLTTGLEYSLESLRMDISIDSTGAPRVTNNPEEIVLGENLQVAVGLKPRVDPNDGALSTVADPSDIDGGYQIEVELDLTSLGYPADLNGEQIWVSFAYFDGDALQDDTQSTTFRAWTLNERDGGASIQGYLDPALDLAVAGESGAPDGAFRTLGSAPNPSSGATRLRYELPTSADVTVEVFDVLGRRVQTVEAGPQAEGRQSVEIDGAALGAGTYLYRVSTEDGASVTGRLTIVR